MITLHGIANCDTVKKARTALPDAAFRDFKKQAPSGAELARWADAVGWEALLNRKGTTFRALSEADRAGLDRDRALALMEAQPSLIKRPVIDDGATVTVGWTPEARAAWGAA
ncbi:ArsC/Spx/MgsR family protein [Sphingomonas sp. ASV193]|uniref:ArsC/Spx/MgsR family protein n=1 Tax=Sphingomonas sp. ASV193 TaxID=3144405 RepID=UPI0032E91098